MTEILLKEALNTITMTPNHTVKLYYIYIKKLTYTDIIDLVCVSDYFRECNIFAIFVSTINSWRWKPVEIN
jgi:hypothetical protein